MRSFVVRVIDVLGFARPSNVANEPRAAVTGSHKTVGRVGSICVLDGPSNEPTLDDMPARATTFESSGERRGTRRQQWRNPNRDKRNAPAVLHEATEWTRAPEAGLFRHNLRKGPGFE